MTTTGRPLIVGEALFDVMPDETRVLGGAPFNVAWHLQAFGLRPLMITRVGPDEAADEVFAAMEKWGMDTSAVQRDKANPTGRVQVELEEGEPTFHILADQAYDHLDGSSAVQSMAGGTFSLLYHGSLISRGEVSASALARIKHHVESPVFVDVNLRDPWWHHDAVVETVRSARWVKLNQSELDLLAGSSDVTAVERFRSKQDLEALILTRGDRGALIADSSGTIEKTPPAGVEVIDTVGAGDAFSAVFILGLMHAWPTEQTLERALDFAAAVCTITGATVTDREFYSRFAERGWW
jgi:fructokinase